jgi:hypothetical protein
MLSWLENIRLSLTQWLWLSTAAVIGFLVAALRIQGSRLHKAQIDALKAAIKYRNVASDTNIEQLRDKMVAEIEAYERAR